MGKIDFHCMDEYAYHASYYTDFMVDVMLCFRRKQDMGYVWRIDIRLVFPDLSHMGQEKTQTTTKKGEQILWMKEA